MRGSLAPWFGAFALLILAFCSFATASVQEATTKHSYSDFVNAEGDKKLSLAGVGVRIKAIGPIRAKVYSVGLYLDRTAAIGILKSKFSGLTAKALAGNRDFDQSLIEESFGKALLLRMARDVGSEKMVSALAESVRPRMNGDDAALGSFQSILSAALKDGGAKNNMVLRFETPAGLSSLKVTIDDTPHGNVNSPALVKALFATYLDKDGVSPTLKSHIASTMPNWLK